MKNIPDTLAVVKQRILTAEIASQRQQGSVSLLAVSKGQPSKLVLTASSCGQVEFAENYVQEGIEKIKTCSLEHLVWHFIGAIQSNKVRLIANYFDWIHSIDRLKIAERLNAARDLAKTSLNVCIQVNMSNEVSKSGVYPEQVKVLADAISCLPRLKLRGLMAIPKMQTNRSMQRIPFLKLRSLFLNLKETYPDIDTLSMGMSHDMEAAIYEGATIVRIGTAIFGPRQ